MTMLSRDLLQIGERRLLDAGIDNSKGDSRELYKYLFDLNDAQLLMEWQNSRDFEQCEQYFQLLDRRANGEPLQYIIGKQNFMGYEIDVSKGVLIPRLDSEIVVEKGAELAIESKAKTLLDLCCGSGAMGIAMGKILGDLKVTFIDISETAIALTKENVIKNSLTARAKILRGDLFSPLRSFWGRKRFDIIISNPPYIPTDVIKTLMKEVRDFEPLEALDGGENGLEFYERIIGDAGMYMKNDAILIMEIGHDQGEAVCNLMKSTGFSGIKVYPDLSGFDRCIVGRWKV